MPIYKDKVPTKDRYNNTFHFDVGDRVVSLTGWGGEVVAVRSHPTNVTYKVRWDKNGRESWERNGINKE